MIRIIFALIWIITGIIIDATMPDTIENHISWCMCIIIANVYASSLFATIKDKNNHEEGCK